MGQMPRICQPAAKCWKGFAARGKSFWSPVAGGTVRPLPPSSSTTLVSSSDGSLVVVNLEDAIAVTQNYVGHRELPSVLDFMQHRPEQVSGFKLISATAGGLDDCDEIVDGVYDLFCRRLAARGDLGSIVPPALEPERFATLPGAGLWEHVKENSDGQGSFSFGFYEESSDEEDIAV